MIEQQHPWYIEWFRDPVRIFDVAYWPAVLTIPFTIGGMVWAWSWVSLFVGLGGLMLHLTLGLFTARVRRRYGVSGPTAEDTR